MIGTAVVLKHGAWSVLSKDCKLSGLLGSIVLHLGITANRQFARLCGLPASGQQPPDPKIRNTSIDIKVRNPKP